MTIITSLDQLKKLSSPEPLDCYISLAGGAIRSSKSIFWGGRKFSIINEIDGSEQRLTPTEIMDASITHIGTAIKNNALITYN